MLVDIKHAVLVRKLLRPIRIIARPIGLHILLISINLGVGAKVVLLDLSFSAWCKDGLEISVIGYRKLIERTHRRI